jgi:hypothetical protein
MIPKAKVCLPPTLPISYLFLINLLAISLYVKREILRKQLFSMKTDLLQLYKIIKSQIATSNLKTNKILRALLC